MGKKKKGEANGTAIAAAFETLDAAYAAERLDAANTAAAAAAPNAAAAVVAAAAASPTAILRVPGYGSSKLDDAEHGMWLRKLSASQREEYLSKLDDAERGAAR
jgi:hypothetical protein